MLVFSHRSVVAAHGPSHVVTSAMPRRRDNCMNNTLTVGQPLQEHGFPPEVRAAHMGSS